MTAPRDGTMQSSRVSVVPLSAEGDETIEKEGARIFVETAAAPLLGARVVDTSADQKRGALTIEDQA